MKRPTPRTTGLQVVVYKITTNFDTYTTMEPVSQEYISAYITYCLTVKKMKLSEIVFEHKPTRIFRTIRPLHTY